MYTVSLAKFSRHPLLRAALLAAGDLYIAECSPYDMVWGTGIDAAIALRMASREEAQSSWPGDNLLSQALVRVRATLEQSRATPNAADTSSDTSMIPMSYTAMRWHE